MSMSEFVRRAFEEGGVQLELLSSLLDCKDLLSADLSLDDKFHLALAEVLKMRSQVQMLQQQVSHIVQDRERMNLLIWTELSRLGTKLEAGGIETPTRSALLAECSTKNDPILRAILGCPGSPREQSPTSADASTLRPSKRVGATTPAIPISRRHHQLRESLDSCRMEDTSDAATGGGGESSSQSRRSAGEVPLEQRYLINSWISKYRSGQRRGRIPTSARDPWLDGEAWMCYVCGQEAKDGPPGVHFCVGKFDSGHREGLKVFCQYCRKGTARMPDLRVHFKKIVYCRVLREELKRALSSEAPGDSPTKCGHPFDDPPEEAPLNQPPMALKEIENGRHTTDDEDDVHTHTQEDDDESEDLDDNKLGPAYVATKV